jgi:hypothetical protein
MPSFLNPNNPASLCNISKVAIFFPSKYCYGNPSQTIPNGYLSTYQVSFGSGTLTETIKSTCLSYWNPANTSDPTNKSTLDQLTQIFAQDYLSWKKVEYDYVFAGILNIAGSGLNDVVEFDYLSEKDICCTRMYTYPLNWTVQNLAHFDATNDCPNSLDTGQPNWDGQPYREYFGPPAKCVGSSLQLTRYGLIFSDGRLGSKYLSTDTL